MRALASTLMCSIEDSEFARLDYYFNIISGVKEGPDDTKNEINDSHRI